MLGHIEALNLLFFLYPHADGHLDDTEYYEGEDEGEAADSRDPDDLGGEVGTSEEGHSERSPDTAGAVHGDGSDRVVDLELVQHDDGEHHDRSGDESHEDGHCRRDCVGTGRDPNKTSEESVEGHGQVRLLGHYPGDKHGTQCSTYRSKGGRDEDKRD